MHGYFLTRRGGAIVTVNGTQLSSVANPLIQVTLVVERGIDRNTSSEFEVHVHVEINSYN